MKTKVSEIAVPIGYHDYHDYGASNEILRAWAQGDLVTAEMLLSEEITNTTSPSHHVLANRALIRARLRRVTLALTDVNRSLQVQQSPIGYIANAVALLGQGNREGALRIFDLAFRVCEPRGSKLLSLLKMVLVFESGC